MLEFHPDRSLAIVFGAHSFPGWPHLLQGPFFLNSANDVYGYFNTGLKIPHQNLLWLFGDSQSPDDQLKAMASFIDRQTQYLKSIESEPEDLFIYYVGHGSFTQERPPAFCLALKSSDEFSRGIRTSSLANVIKARAGFCRRYLILDCCFAADAAYEFQSTPLDVVRRELREALRGTSLLCAAPKDSPALTPQGADRTMFCSALMKALREGHPNAGERLSFNELGILVEENIRAKYPQDYVRPEVHSPDQREGDIAVIPLFPNPAYRQVQPIQPITKPASPAPPAEVPAGFKDKTTPRPPDGAQLRLDAQKAAAERILKAPAERKSSEAARLKPKPDPPPASSVETAHPVPIPRPIAFERAPDKFEKDKLEKEKLEKDQLEKDKPLRFKPDRESLDAAERKRLTQEAAADRILQAAKERRLADAKKRARERVPKSSFRPSTAPPPVPSLKSYEPEPPMFSAPETSSTSSNFLAISAVIGVAIAINVGLFFVGRLWASALKDGTIFGIHSADAIGFISFLLGGFVGGIYLALVGKDPDLRLCAWLLWPGFVLGFRFFNDLSPEAQPGVLYALLTSAGFIYVSVFYKKT